MDVHGKCLKAKCKCMKGAFMCGKEVGKCLCVLSCSKKLYRLVIILLDMSELVANVKGPSEWFCKDGKDCWYNGTRYKDLLSQVLTDFVCFDHFQNTQHWSVCFLIILR